MRYNIKNEFPELPGMTKSVSATHRGKSKDTDRRTVYFHHEIDPNHKFSGKAELVIGELKNLVETFSILSGVPLKDIGIYFGYQHSYYDSVEIDLEISGSRLENDEEYGARMGELKIQKEKEAAQELANQLRKEERDKKEYERLKKKFAKETS